MLWTALNRPVAKAISSFTSSPTGCELLRNELEARVQAQELLINNPIFR
jgi:hypothetical protein